jgi:hypothetical protein
VGSFAAHDHPRPVGVGGQVEQVGDLGDVGAVAQLAVGVDGGLPVHAGGDRFPDRFGDRDPDGEGRAYAVLAQAADVTQEGVAGPGRVAPDQDVAAVAEMIRDLSQGLVEDGDVIGRRVRAGVTGPQQTGEGFAGGVQKHSSGW